MATRHPSMNEIRSRPPVRYRGPRGLDELLAHCPPVREPDSPEKANEPALGQPTSKADGDGASRRVGIGDIIHFVFHLLGMVISTQLIVWGVFFLMFLLLGNASIDGMMVQLANLSTRYVEAGFERQTSFKWMFAAADLLMCLCVILLRHRSLVPPVRAEAAHNA